MDTQTGKFVYLTKEQAEEAQAQWAAWQAGLLEKMPRFAPVEGDSAPVKPKRRKLARKAKRSYKDFCN